MSTAYLPHRHVHIAHIYVMRTRARARDPPRGLVGGRRKNLAGFAFGAERHVRAVRAAAEHHAILATCRIQLKDCWGRRIRRGCSKGLEEALHEPLAVLLGVEERRGHDQVAQLGVDLQLAKGIVPVRFHCIPILHDASSHRLHIAGALEAARS